jgi:ABC-2 type transport system ATP-binding protein
MTVPAGERVALLGPNGAGKSTLLRILATTVLPDAGEVRVLGYDVARNPIAVRRVVGASLGDERSWYWRLSGRRNLEFFAVLHGASRRAARARSDSLLRQVGMRARLSLARALVNQPSVLLLDEPTRSLDPIASVDFRETLTRLAREDGICVLFATHDLHEAAEVADRVVGLHEGRVAFEQGVGASAAELEAAILAATR